MGGRLGRTGGNHVYGLSRQIRCLHFEATGRSFRNTSLSKLARSVNIGLEASTTFIDHDFAFRRSTNLAAPVMTETLRSAVARGRSQGRVATPERDDYGEEVSRSVVHLRTLRQG